MFVKGLNCQRDIFIGGVGKPWCLRVNKPGCYHFRTYQQGLHHWSMNPHSPVTAVLACRRPPACAPAAAHR